MHGLTIYKPFTIFFFVVMSSALIIQNSCVAITTVMIFLLAVFGLTEDQKKETPNQNNDSEKPLFVWPFQTTISIILFFSCTIVGAVSELAAMVTSVARTKDWCVVIARSESLSLEKINSMMRRLDMISLIMSPVIFGLIVTFAGYKVGTIIVCAWNVISLFPEYFFIYKVYAETKDLHISKLEQERKIKEERERELAAQNTEDMEQIDLEQKKEEPPTVNLKHQNIFKVRRNGIWPFHSNPTYELLPKIGSLSWMEAVYSAKSSTLKFGICITFHYCSYSWWLVVIIFKKP